ncbi:unnamed protein product [Ceutorhynchus assimilis]|uniref:MBD domain-containing protein n=1 Tax=Ceutorhynchus assimilis TaxID=467358 RepID=A0A9P0DK18_9CUCU|nr:unnamed protein product [Ceutorhynchus assimilis]
MENEDSKMESETVVENSSPVTEIEASKETNVELTEAESASSEKSTQNGALEPNKIPENDDNQTKESALEPVEVTEPKITENGAHTKELQVGTQKNSEKPEEEKLEQEQEIASNNTIEENPTRVTRGTKRKANDEINEITREEASNKKIQQKENQNESSHLTKEDLTSNSYSNSNVMGKGRRARVPNKRYSEIMLTPPNKKSSVAAAKVPMEEPIDDPMEAPMIALEKSLSVKDDLLGDFAGFDSAITAASSTKSKVTHDFQDPKYLKPFKYGWKRELVWRSTNVRDQLRMGDIYYYNPAGQKLRSFREISQHLNNEKLTLDNFLFFKVPLGVNDPDKEIVRHAGEGRKSTSSKATPRKTDSLVVGVTPTNSRSKRSSAVGVINAAREKEKEVAIPSSPRNKKKAPAKRGRSAKKTDLLTKPEPMEVDLAPTKSRTRTSLRQGKDTLDQSKTQSRNQKPKRVSSSSEGRSLLMANYLQNLAFGYTNLLSIFQYLKVQDLLRAGRACKMWRDISRNPILWETIRMKNSKVYSFEGLSNALKRYNTVNLDLRKMLLPNKGNDIWPEFSNSIGEVQTLKKIEFCRCPAAVMEKLPISNPNLEIINSVMIKSDIMNFDSFANLNYIKELRIKAVTSMTLNSILSLKELKNLKILALTSVLHLNRLELSVLAELTNLESLDLGECTEFPATFGQDVLIKLEKLEKLRLEKGQDSCHTFELLDTVKDMKNLQQLELINFDIKAGFDKAIESCTQLKKLMIIPTYVSQSATTNNMVMASALRLRASLTHFVWGVTLELIRVTELFVDQCDDKKNKKVTGTLDCIPVLKPVPDISKDQTIQPASNPPQVEILPLTNLQKLLLNSLPTTRVKILKIPFHATWRQTLQDSAYL